MKLVPTAVSRFAGLSRVKINNASPTLLVVGGVIGFGATAIMAAKASRRAEPVVEDHQKARIQIAETSLSKEDERKNVISLYRHTSLEMVRVYGPTVVVGTASAASILYGHKLLSRRHVATLMAFSGLQDQFAAYRSRVAKTLGVDAERDIYDGAHGEWIEDPDHKGEYKLQPVWDEDGTPSYFRPWFDERNDNCQLDPSLSLMFLESVEKHANVKLNINGVVYLNEVLAACGIDEVPEGQVAGWLAQGDGDRYIDFGLNSNDPATQEFRNGFRRDVRLNFNCDGNVNATILAAKYDREGDTRRQLA